MHPIAPNNDLLKMLKSNLMEVRARGGEQVGEGQHRYQCNGYAFERVAVGEGHLASTDYRC